MKYLLLLLSLFFGKQIIGSDSLPINLDENPKLIIIRDVLAKLVTKENFEASIKGILEDLTIEKFTFEPERMGKLVSKISKMLENKIYLKAIINDFTLMYFDHYKEEINATTTLKSFINLTAIKESNRFFKEFLKGMYLELNNNSENEKK